MALVCRREGFVVLDVQRQAAEVLGQLSFNNAPHSLHRVELTAYGIEKTQELDIKKLAFTDYEDLL